VGRRAREGADVIRATVRFLDQRSGTAPFLMKTLRYLFPDHWSFLLGEVALYLFIVLVATGVYLTFFFEPSFASTTYDGSYEPLRGVPMSEAYRSVVEISFDVKAGLLIRQAHHWAADAFVAAIVIHLLRIFFTGAFRKPRELTWLVGLTVLFTALLEGYLGYSMADDLLSGMGLAIGYSVAMSIPLLGANLTMLLWGAPYPGDPSFESRMYITHVLILPVVIAVLLTIHLTLVALRHHTQFRGDPRASERTIVGVPTFPGQTPRSLGLLIGVTAVIFLLGGLVQINPVWQWGPYETGLSTNGAQPDWYLGWLIGALRLVPGFDVTIGNFTLVPNPFWGGVLFPLIVLAVLVAYPFVERRLTRDPGYHNLLQRPRDVPGRTAFGLAFFVWVALLFFAGAADRVFVLFDLSYVTQVWIYRGLVWVAPVIVFFVTRRVCVELQEAERVERASESVSRGVREAVPPVPRG
jgi:ubiquinol-cytochrome c reductase cytochrome b subunit